MPRPSPTPALLLSGLLVLPACYEAPLNEEFPGLGNSISGQVIIDRRAASGPAFLLLTPADNPSPPLGTGTPVTFTTVPARAFDITVDGLRAAPFAFRNIPDGEYFLTALLDQDRNFHPIAPTLAGATCGDASGIYLDSLVALNPQTIEVSDNAWRRNVSVVVLRDQDNSRPSFTFDPGQTLSFGGSYTLRSEPITATFGSDLRIGIPGPYDNARPDDCAAAFWYRRVDSDGDGTVDRDPDNPLAERKWPRVLLRWIGQPVDDDGDGQPDRFERVFNGESVPDDVIYGSAATPAPPEGVDEPEPNEVVPFTELEISVAPLGRRIDPTTGPEGETIDASQMPPGAYSITVIAESGQTWPVPNELAIEPVVNPIPVPGVTSPPNPSQGSFLLLP